MDVKTLNSAIIAEPNETFEIHVYEENKLILLNQGGEILKVILRENNLRANTMN